MVIGLVVVFSVAYVAAEHAGLTTEEYVRGLLENLRHDPASARWVGPAIGGLLAADLVLPVPSSVVMTLAGHFLGWLPGAAWAAGGALLSAVLGFGLCRWLGQRWFQRIVTPAEQARVERLLARYGPWVIVFSRSVPMLTEVVSCVAGLGAMSFARFLALNVAGTVPLCLVYAWAGARHGGAAGFGWAVVLAFVLPAAGYGLLRVHERRVPR